MRLIPPLCDSFYGGGGTAIVEGDTEAALADADVVVEGELKASSVWSVFLSGMANKYSWMVAPRVHADASSCYFTHAYPPLH